MSEAQDQWEARQQKKIRALEAEVASLSREVGVLMEQNKAAIYLAESRGERLDELIAVARRERKA